jgi:hypothetical protein
LDLEKERGREGGGGGEEFNRRAEARAAAARAHISFIDIYIYQLLTYAIY